MLRRDQRGEERKKGNQFGGYGNIQAGDESDLDQGESKGDSGKYSDTGHI